METISMVFLIQEVVKKVIDLVAGRIGVKLTKQADSLSDLFSVHRALGNLALVIDEMDLDVSTNCELAHPKEFGPGSPGYKDLFDYRRSLTDRAEDALEELETSMRDLTPKLEVFSPNIVAAIRSLTVSEVMFIDEIHHEIQVEEKVSAEDLPRLRAIVGEAREAVAAFIKANYSIRDSKN